MAADTDTEMKVVTGQNSINIDNYRKLVQNYLKLNLYQTALFWADKVVALSYNNPKDIYWLAQCMFLLKQYHRAAHLLKANNLEKTHILCNYLTVRCLKEANELNEALRVISLMDAELVQCDVPTNCDNDMFDDTPKQQVKSGMLLLKGKILEAMDNRGLAADCFKEALKCDVYCFEAFDSLTKHQMLSIEEEEEVIRSLPISQQCNEAEAEVLLTLYDCKRKKYHTPIPQKLSNNKIPSPNGKGSSTNMIHTPNSLSTPISISTPNYAKNINKKIDRYSNKKTQDNSEKMNVDGAGSGALERLQCSLDLAVSEAERLYYNCDYQQCTALTEAILKQDPYHHDCLPLHVACQVELKQTNKLFALAHNLVDLYPDLAVSWFAVGCYYHTIGGKGDSARRYLAKATCLDKLFGPAWLAYGHSFAIESEHDQAMAAYFKASQLMRGCHLPLLYIGLECGLTNNVRLAMKFFQQAQAIAPEDPFVMHEMGVIAYQNLDYELAEKYFKTALKLVKRIKSPSLPQRWQPLLNNLGHTCRKLKKYEEALEHHKQALTLHPHLAGTYSAIAYIHALMGHTEEAVDWFHKALGLNRDDIFSTTMLNYVIAQFSEDQPPYPDAPSEIPDYHKLEQNTVQDSVVFSNESGNNQTASELADMSMSM